MSPKTASTPSRTPLQRAASWSAVVCFASAALLFGSSLRSNAAEEDLGTVSMGVSADSEVVWGQPIYVYADLTDESSSCTYFNDCDPPAGTVLFSAGGARVEATLDPFRSSQSSGSARISWACRPASTPSRPTT